MNEIQRPVFIVGAGRSGTTFLGKLLSLHPDVIYFNEPRAMMAKMELPVDTRVLASAQEHARPSNRNPRAFRSDLHAQIGGQLLAELSYETQTGATSGRPHPPDAW